jgi:thioredoxin reductase (NADPH)
MQGRPVHVVGVANSAGQAALRLAGHAAHATLVVRRSNLTETMSDYLVRAIQAAPNVTVRYRTEVIDGSGDGQLTTLTLRDRSTGAQETMATGGLFPRAAHLLATDLHQARRQGVPGHWRGPSHLIAAQFPWHLPRPPFPFETSTPGVFAVGDVQHGRVKRVAAAVGDGSVLFGSLHEYLAQTGRPPSV